MWNFGSASIFSSSLFLSLYLCGSNSDCLKIHSSFSIPRSLSRSISL
jgi:hypothetical protein